MENLESLSGALYERGRDLLQKSLHALVAQCNDSDHNLKNGTLGKIILLRRRYMESALIAGYIFMSRFLHFTVLDIAYVVALPIHTN